LVMSCKCIEQVMKRLQRQPEFSDYSASSGIVGRRVFVLFRSASVACESPSAAPAIRLRVITLIGDVVRFPRERVMT
jgi:hypothetical protein